MQRTIYKSQCEVVGQWGHQDVAIFDDMVYRIRNGKCHFNGQIFEINTDLP